MADDSGGAGFFATTFGWGLGEMRLRLTERNFSVGDMIRGRIELKLAEPSEAKGLFVEIQATQKVGAMETDSQGRKSFTEQTVTVYEHSEELDGKRTYYDGEGFDFALKVPDVRIKHEGGSGGPVGDVARAVASIFRPVRFPVSWWVRGYLRFNWHKSDVKQRVSIQVALPKT